MAIDIERDSEPGECNGCDSPDAEPVFQIEIGAIHLGLCEDCLRDLGKAIDAEIAA